MTKIHPTALVDPKAQIDSTAEIGPFCTIGPDVQIGANVRLVSHVAVDGLTAIGEGTEIFPFASLGMKPQDLKYKGEASRLVIGARNQIRENVTMNTGTEGGGMETRVGDDCLFMVGAHVAHDCLIGNNVILVNNATLGGHVIVQDFAILGGMSAVHQFVRIGKHAMIGGMTGVEHDVIPFGTVTGNRAFLVGLNLTGLKRRGFSREEIHALRAAYRVLFAEEGSFAERTEKTAATFAESKAVMEIIAFVKEDSSRSFCQPKAGS